MVKCGIIGGADIAFRFVNASKKNKKLECVCVATRSEEKAVKFKNMFGVNVVNDYNELILNNDVDVIYLPLPPALHYKWAMLALQNNKHVFLEKPSTTSILQSTELVGLAKRKGLVLQENYMFQYHSQLRAVRDIIAEGKIGQLRLIKTYFGFPKRSSDDFRYNKDLGGGALFDAGGYVIKLASLFLGQTIELQSSADFKMKGFDVDMFGTASFINGNGLVCQGAYGLDCFYQCILDVWGNEGRLFTNRIFTAPDDFKPVIIVEDVKSQKKIILNEDDQFAKSIDVFAEAINDNVLRLKMYDDLLMQAKLVEDIRNNNMERGHYNDKVH